jgi:pimeloyl-ACP methyl ester carboxylesterase
MTENHSTIPEKSFHTPEGNVIAYNQLEVKGNLGAGVIFMGGFKSDKEGSKALFLEEYCLKNGVNFVRFDYSGHGHSDGTFEEGTISSWTADAIAVLDTLTKGPQILIGSSMGGWIMLLTALARKERIAGLMGIAAAPDFTETLIWDALKPEEQAEIMEKGVYNLPSEYCDDPEESDYPITKALIEDGRKNLLLQGDIDLPLPTILLHGIQDADVPPEISSQIMARLTSDDVQVNLLKNGDHRMSTPDAITLLEQSLTVMLGKLKH